MTTSSGAPPKSNGLATVIDTIIAPSDAFDRLRVAPTWGWAFALFVLLFAVGYVMEFPAATHATVGTMQHLFETNSFYSAMSEDRRRIILASIEHPSTVQIIAGSVETIIIFAITMLFNALMLLIANAIGRGVAGFKSLWAASVNIAVPSIGIGAVLLGIICLARGPNAFATTRDLIMAMPSLAMLAPGLKGFASTALATVTAFVLWGGVLNYLALRRTAAVSNVLSTTFAALILVCFALIFGALLLIQGA